MPLAVVSTTSDTEQEGDTGPTFADFWLLYPRKVKRKDTERMWGRLSDKQRLEAVVGLVPWRAYWLKKEELEYVPHPSTWLHGERWTDELPREARTSCAAHVPAVLPKVGERSVMPPDVVALIANLKGRK